MNTGRTIFAQLMDFVPLPDFAAVWSATRATTRCKVSLVWTSFSVWLCPTHLSRESARHRSVLACPARQALITWAFAVGVSRNNLANANEHRDWRIYADFAQRARSARPATSTATNLSGWNWPRPSMPSIPPPSICVWRCFPGRNSAAARARSSCIPCWTCAAAFPTSVYVTGGQVHDVNLLDQLLLEAGAFYLLDRGYVDFARLVPVHPSVALSSSPAPSRTCSSTVRCIAPGRSRPRACAPIKPFA